VVLEAVENEEIHAEVLSAGELEKTTVLALQQ